MAQRNELKNETVKETKEVAFTATCDVTAKSILLELDDGSYAATLPKNKLLICRNSKGLSHLSYDSHKMIDLKTFEEQPLPFSMQFRKVLGAVDDTLICAYLGDDDTSYQIRLYDLKTGKMTPSSLCGLVSYLNHHGTELLWINHIYSDNGNVKQVRIYSLPDISTPRYTSNLNHISGISSAALFKQNHLLVTCYGGEVRHYQREDNFKEHKKLSEDDNTQWKELVSVGNKCVFMINRRPKNQGESSISCWTLGADNTFKKCRIAKYDQYVHGIRPHHFISTGSRLITFNDKSFFVWDERLKPARIDVGERIDKILVCQDGKEENDIIVQTWSRKLIKMSLGPILDLKHHLNHTFFPSCYQPLANSRPVVDMIAGFAEDEYEEPVAAAGAGPGQR